MVAEMTTPPYAQLVDNGTQVLMLQTALSKSETNAKTIPSLIKIIDRDRAWRQFALPNESERLFEWKAADFRRFIESPRPAGCQTPLHLLERMLRGTDAWETFLELTRGEPGGNNNPEGINETSNDDVNCDNVTVDIQERKSNKPSPTGNSTSYALRRLKRQRPDLYELVKSGEMTPNAAMVAAGFRVVRFTVSQDPREAGRRLAQHFTREQFSLLVDEAAKVYTGEQGGE